MTRLLIVHHTPSPNTRALLEAACVSIRTTDPELECIVLDSLEADAEVVRRADGVLVATTENFGAMAGRTKDFFERIYYPIGQDLAGLPFALYIRAGEDGQGALQGIERIVTGMRWRTVQPPEILKGQWRPQMLDQARELAATFAAGLSAGIF